MGKKALQWERMLKGAVERRDPRNHRGDRAVEKGDATQNRDEKNTLSFSFLPSSLLLVSHQLNLLESKGAQDTHFL